MYLSPGWIVSKRVRVPAQALQSFVECEAVEDLSRLARLWASRKAAS